MSQSRIRSFFSAVPDDAYTAQLQRDRDEHAVAREQLLYQQAVMRARHCMEREAGEPRKCGLSEVLSAETQVDAVLFCVSNAEPAPGVEPDQSPEPDSDGEEEIEEGMCDGPTESE